MTRDELITRQDREVWERYRLTWRTAPDDREGMPHAPADDGIDGLEAGRIAAYLDDNLSEAERRAVERRLVENPVMLDALIASKAGLRDGPTHAHEAPRSVRARAADIVDAELAKRDRGTSATIYRLPRRRLAVRPAMAAIAASLVLAVAAGAGTFLLSGEEPQTVAHNDRPTEAPDASRQWDPRTNSIFANPENAYFDGLDVE